MTDKNIHEEISSLNEKLDRLMEYVEIQRRKREEWDDLMSDLSIVGKDMFSRTVQVLDDAEIELDPCGLQCLMLKTIRNLSTFGQMLEMMESARDFMADAVPIFRQMGLDTINKFHEFEQKGYIDYIKELGKTLDKWTQVYTVEDVKKLQGNLEQLAGILKNLSDPYLLASLNRITKTLSEVRPDEKLDERSLWQIIKQLRSPEIRRSLSYSMRLIHAINQPNNSNH